MVKTNHYRYNSAPYSYKNLYECAGLNCPNNAKYMLKIKHFNKIGHFCQQCTDGLIQSDLGEKI